MTRDFIQKAANEKLIALIIEGTRIAVNSEDHPRRRRHYTDHEEILELEICYVLQPIVQLPLILRGQGY
jgi:hypothetical protein